MDTRVVELTDAAVDTITAMRERVWQLGSYYGQSDDKVIKAMDSLFHNLIALNNRFFGSHAVVSKDGELSLFVAEYADSERRQSGNAGFVYGLIWHEDRRKCEKCGSTQGYEYYLSDNDKAEAIKSCATVTYTHHGTNKRDVTAKVTWDRHEWNIPVDAPMPGTWSFHS